METKIKELEYEKIIIKILFHREDLRNVILPHLKLDVFKDENNRYIVDKIFMFYNKFKKFPTTSDLLALLDPERNEYIRSFKSIDLNSYTKEYLEKEIESFIKNRLYQNVMLEYVEALSEGKEPDLTKIQRVSTFYFDNSVGLDFFDDSDRLYDALKNGEEFVPTKMEKFDSFLGGGFLKKGLTLFIAGTGVGKSIFMCHFTATLSKLKKKVLYVTLEMPEERIARRIDTNILNVDRLDLINMPREKYIELKRKYKEKYGNNIIIKWNAAHEFSVNNLRNLTRELKEKKDFEPEVIFIDYMGLMRPNFVSKDQKEDQSLKRISEELFAFAGEKNVAVVSAMQFNRDGMKSETAGKDKIAGSIGSTFAADEIILIKQNEELKKTGKYKLEKDKSRDGISGNFIYLNIDYSKMILTEDEEIRNTKNNDQIKETTDTKTNKLDLVD